MSLSHYFESMPIRLGVSLSDYIESMSIRLEISLHMKILRIYSNIKFLDYV